MLDCVACHLDTLFGNLMAAQVTNLVVVFSTRAMLEVTLDYAAACHPGHQEYSLPRLTTSTTTSRWSEQILPVEKHGSSRAYCQ